MRYVECRVQPHPLGGRAVSHAVIGQVDLDIEHAWRRDVGLGFADPAEHRQGRRVVGGHLGQQIGHARRPALHQQGQQGRRHPLALPGVLHGHGDVGGIGEIAIPHDAADGHVERAVGRLHDHDERDMFDAVHLVHQAVQHGVCELRHTREESEAARVRRERLVLRRQRGAVVPTERPGPRHGAVAQRHLCHVPVAELVFRCLVDRFVGHPVSFQESSVVGLRDRTLRSSITLLAT